MKGRRNPPARINQEKCTGCEQCYIDCPYEAIIMREVEREKKAILNEGKCAGCGICVSSCSMQAISIPTFPVEEVMRRIKEEKTFLCSFQVSLQRGATREKRAFDLYPPVRRRFEHLLCRGGLTHGCKGARSGLL